ncbi:M20 metallopeptidase family protein [Nonomuraea roseoviolacea]|uniref:Hippurate hydrolase n=1 Tax=Nonomuraea roseoviolacea subsp. carminata TaxID=160689 RepID=A0ABT1KDL0_9ACTN|nr:M20 family metallopeptidase [Nonomuraea roseoviolacea]MCP2351747.1 hippurate hydrolase [Nonomuraea roseoviolacea subsp. carminata]
MIPTGLLVSLRRALHAEPELGLALPSTQRRVLDALGGLPLEITLGAASTSVTAVLRGRGRRSAAEGPVVLLRADMDALPVQERTALPYASREPGVMHACGHDLHTAMLVGAAHLLCAARDDLPGDVILMFQPGEEGHDGAAVMLSEGVLEAAGAAPLAAYALHVQSVRRAGVFATRAGTVLSGTARMRVTVHGKGGHGAVPHRALDPVPPLAEMITAVHALVTRRFDAFDPVVVTVGHVSAGSHGTAIPDSAFFEATIRTYSEHNRVAVRGLLRELVTGIAAVHGTTAEIDYGAELPVTVTDPAETAFAGGTIEQLWGTRRLAAMPHPHPASEDFSRVLARVPGAFVFLGARPARLSRDEAQENHSPRAEFDDAVLDDGARLLAELAARRLRAAGLVT